MLTLGRKLPIEGGRDAFAPEGVGHRLARKQSTAVHPRAKVGGYRDIRRCRDDALHKGGLLTRQLVEQRAEAELRGHRRVDGDRQLARHIERRRLQPARAVLGDRYAVKKGLQSIRWYRQTFEPAPLVSG